MAITSNDVANQAVQLVGNTKLTPVQGQFPTFDNTPTGIALQKLYGPCVQTVGRQYSWDMARQTVALVLTGNVAPFPWSLEYGYPPNGIEVWQLLPNALGDVNNPLPFSWVIANGIVAGAQQRVIWANLPNAYAVYNNNPNENTWDSLFREAVVRLLASELAMAIAGKPDAMQAHLEIGAAFQKMGEGREY